MTALLIANFSGDPSETSRSGPAEIVSSHRERIPSRHVAKANEVAGRRRWSAADKGSDHFVQATPAAADLANEKRLMLKLSLLAIALVSTGLFLLALG